MKKFINIAFAYAVSAMVGGVYFREFTKFNGFTGVTALGKVHTHLFLLGMIVFLMVALFAAHSPLREQKQFKAFMVFYNIGVPLTALMMLTRGTLQVLGTALSVGANAAISGISGIGHILTGTGIVLLLLSLKKIAKN
ncbi:MAG: DUF2871 domain-containing protein [Oscillospiraceae bacterium]